MSLLIKALDKAQAEKAQAEGSTAKQKTDHSKSRSKSQAKQPATKATNETGLSLSPPEDTVKTDAVVKAKADEIPATLKGSAADNVQQETQKNRTEKPASTQTQAANVFAVKRVEPAHKTAKLAIIIGLVALLIMAALLYWYEQFINVPDIVIPPRPAIAVSSQDMPAPLPEMTAANEGSALVAPELAETAISPEMKAEVTEEVSPSVTAEKDGESREVFATEETPKDSAPSPSVKETLTPNEEVIGADVDITPSIVAPINVGIASESASIQVTQAKAASGVNPILMRAYEAYNAGNDQQAQQGYKEVLQRYGANVDAMLGLGAIATRQGRLADANGWYRKILEVEPRNAIANAGLLSVQQKNQTQGNESNIKSMLASTPSDANLHAALGDVYANKGQWPEAQQAYFDAYRFNPSGENAFNLGVSLDQMGKPSLALPYYQEALQKASQSSVIDAAALEARISTIQ